MPDNRPTLHRAKLIKGIEPFQDTSISSSTEMKLVRVESQLFKTSKGGVFNVNISSNVNAKLEKAICRHVDNAKTIKNGLLFDKPAK
ncbi:hypothetical protein R4Y45_06135 [Holzapfeliella sp. He02]|uniref:Uncharacterized protein n=1 Tax=Holzapfeliella saturejae TaxID=3082953 RepID=A0ABU8SHT9_9LACO